MHTPEVTDEKDVRADGNASAKAEGSAGDQPDGPVYSVVRKVVNDSLDDKVC